LFKIVYKRSYIVKGKLEQISIRPTYLVIFEIFYLVLKGQKKFMRERILSNFLFFYQVRGQGIVYSLAFFVQPPLLYRSNGWLTRNEQKTTLKKEKKVNNWLKLYLAIGKGIVSSPAPFLCNPPLFFWFNGWLTHNEQKPAPKKEKKVNK